MPAKTRPFDPARYLKSEESQIAYLEAAFETGDPDFIQHCIGVVARAQGMTRLAARAELGRTSLYKALDEKGNPEFTTVMKVLSAMGVRLIPICSGRHRDIDHEASDHAAVENLAPSRRRRAPAPA